MWNVEPALSLCDLIKALILRDWGSEGTRGHGGRKRKGRKVRDKGVDEGWSFEPRQHGHWSPEYHSTMTCYDRDQGFMLSGLLPQSIV